MPKWWPGTGRGRWIQSLVAEDLDASGTVLALKSDGPGDAGTSRGLAPEVVSPMHDQPRAGSSSLPDTQDVVALALLDIFVAQHPAILSSYHLVRLYAGGRLDYGDADPIVTDGLVDLLANGLIHRLGGFVFASRSALRTRELFR